MTRAASLAILMCAFSVPLAHATNQEDARGPVPSVESQRHAEKIVREVFKEEFARAEPAERVVLSRKLLKQGLESAGDAAAQFVLFREAKDLAAQAGDVGGALEAATEMASRFQVDGPGLKSAALAKAGALVKTPEQAKRAAEAYLSLVEEALLQDQPDTAEKAAVSGAAFARKAKDLSLVTRFESRSKEIGASRAESEKLKQARQTLAAKPEDPTANLAVGKHLCAAKADWVPGLKHLSKGSDLVLKELAARDLAGPSTTVEQVGVGDAWWAVAEKEGAPWKARAAFWYAKALPNLSGLNRVKLERRLAEAGPPLPAAGEVDLLALVDPGRDSVEGAWRKEGGTLVSPLGRLVRIQVPYEPPDEYDVKLVVERKEGLYSLEIGLAFRGNQFHVGLDGFENGDITSLYVIDGKTVKSNETTHRGKLILKDVSTTIVCSVRTTGVALRVGEKGIFDWKGDPSRLMAAAMWSVPRKDMLFLGAWDSRFHIREMTLIPASGEGGKGK